MNELSITIPGKPIAKARPKFYRRGGFVGAYNAQETEEGRFMQFLHMAKPEGWRVLQGPVRIEVQFLMPIPTSTSKKKKLGMVLGTIRHVKKPDCDNLLKFVKDCANGVLWRDDSQIFSLYATKFYSNNPATIILIRWEDEEVDQAQHGQGCLRKADTLPLPKVQPQAQAQNELDGEGHAAEVLHPMRACSGSPRIG